MIELGFGPEQVHPHRDAEFPNYSVKSLIITDVLSQYYDGLQILTKWLPKVANGGTLQVTDYDFESLLILADETGNVEQVRMALYGNHNSPRHSCLRYEEVVEIVKNNGLKLDSISIENGKFYLGVSR